jgi:hypothetical protein
MFRLAITLIKKYGFQKATEMAPRFGINKEALRHATDIMNRSQRGTMRTWGNPVVGRGGMHMTPQRPHYSRRLSEQMRAPAVRPREIGQGPGGIRQGLEQIGRRAAPIAGPNPYGQRIKNIDVLIAQMKRFKQRGSGLRAPANRIRRISPSRRRGGRFTDPGSLAILAAGGGGIALAMRKAREMERQRFLRNVAPDEPLNEELENFYG